MSVGKVYTIVKNDTAARITVQNHEYTDLPEIAGRENTGVQTGIVHQSQDAATKVVKTVIAPYGYLAPHAAPTTVCLYILKGSGEVGNIDNNEKLINKIDFTAGDTLIFETPMPLHYYKAGSRGAEYIAIVFPN
jgi:quercetin dioxygenase-like cupin family protein